MPFEICAQAQEGFVRVTHTGEVDLAELEEAREQSRVAMQATGITRIFVDATAVTNTLRMTEHFVFNASHPMVLPPDVKIAIVFNAFTFDYNKYVEDAAGAMGTNLRAFVDMEEAKGWLVG